MKLLIKIFFILVLFLGIFWFFRNQAQAPTDGPDLILPAVQIKADLAIDFGGGKAESYPGAVLDGEKTVFSLLQAYEKSTGQKIGYKDYGGDMGVLIESINNVANDPQTGTYWQFWVNGEYAKVGASAYQLKAGDKVEWKYIKSQIK